MDSKILFKDDVNKIKEYLSVHPEDINKYVELYPENINIVANNMTPLMHAVSHERIDVIDCLIEHGCDINFQIKRGMTALHCACWALNININRDIIERLISNGASGLIKNIHGSTALHDAAINAKDVNIIHQLLIVSDPNSLNVNGSNSLMTGCSYNSNIEIISALINVTHDINLQNNHGSTALHYSCYYKNYEAIKLLLSSGADLVIEDNKGRTPYDLADKEGKRIIDEHLASKK